MPSVCLDSPVAVLESSFYHLLAITENGTMHVWNVKSRKAAFAPVSISPIMVTPEATITAAFVRDNGSPLIISSSGIAYSYDLDLMSLVKVSEAWWSLGSTVWADSHYQPATSRNIVSSTLR